MNSIFLVADTQLYKSLCPSVRSSVGEHESKSGKTRISAPAHPSATGIGRVSGLVNKCVTQVTGGRSLFGDTTIRFIRQKAKNHW